MIYVLLADGFEEVEALAPVDIMRRCGIDVKIAGVGGDAICGSHSIKVACDMRVEEIDKGTVEGIILPGGMPGTLNLQQNETVMALLKHCIDNNLLLCAICAAPMILGEAGYLDGREATCFPGFEEHLKGASVSGDAVVKSGNIITGKGAGAALEFGAAIVDYVTGQSGKGAEILAQMQY